MNHERDFFLNLVHRIQVIQKNQTICVRRSPGKRRHWTTKVSYDLVTGQRNHDQSHDLQYPPRSRDTRPGSRPAIINKQRQARAGEKAAEVRCIADETTSDKADEQINEDN